MSRATCVALALLGGLLVPATLFGQGTGVLEGTVTARSTTRPMADVTVNVVGTTRGTRTDEAGKFRISGLPAGDYQVRAQRLGFSALTRPATVVAGQTATVTFALSEAALSLDAVVTTGTAAESRKKEVGNATATIDARSLENQPVLTPQEILQGRAAGITVLGNSGQPGAGGTIRLRGNNSISQGNSPILYVDGVRIYSEGGPITPSARQSAFAINDIKADDIERIEVVKGAAATTLYGTEASGGVIQIFTKRGASGAPRWTLDVAGGVNKQGHVGPESDVTGLFLNECRGANLKDAFDVAFTDPTCPESGTWLSTGALQKYALSVTGGGEALTYYFSGNYNSAEGVIAPGGERGGGFRGNFSFAPARNMTFAVNTSYNKKLIRWIPDGNLANGFFLNVARGPSNNFKGGKGECVTITTICTTNGYILVQDVTNNTDHFIVGGSMNWSPSVRFTNRFNVGYDYNDSDNKSLIPFGFLNLATGSLNSQSWNHTKLSLDYAGSFISSLWRTPLSSTFSWGGQIFDDRERFTGVTGVDFSGPGTPTLASAARVTLGSDTKPRVVNAGFFLQEMMGWKDRLFVTAGLRVDGNSAFGQDFGLQKYPKISAAYVVSEESFWPARLFPTFKLRAAMGESGKAPGAFDAVRTWDPVAGDDGRPGVTVAQKGNPDLGPERTREMEAGFDVSLPNDKVVLEATMYRARTYGALIGVTYPPSEGFSRNQLENIGTIQNSGLELSATASVIRLREFDWELQASFTSMRSKAIELMREGDLVSRIIPTGLGSSVREGRPVPALYGSVITNPDAFADPVVQTDQYIGPVYPTRLVGVRSTFNLPRGLRLDAQGDYQGGAWLTNFIGYQNALRNIWQPCYEAQKKLRAANGPDNIRGNADDVPSAIADVTARDRARCSLDGAVRNSDFWASKTDFFKLRSVSLSYDMPARLLPRTHGATLTLAGRNLYKWTKFDGVDPEANDASDAGTGLGRREYYTLPPYRSFQASVRVSF